MFENNDAAMGAFNAELEKLGVGALARRIGQRALAGGGLGALTASGGAALGAAAGGVRGYRQAAAEGQPGAMGALRGGLRGAALGGAAGLAAGTAAGAAGGKATQRLVSRIGAKKGPMGPVTRFGQRQVHSVTGALPAAASRREALRSMGAGIGEMEKRIAETKKRLRGMATGDPKRARAARELQSLQKGLQYGQRAEELGMTSVPGLFRAVATRPGEALRTGLGSQWYGSPSRAGKFMTFGVPGAVVAGEALTPTKAGGEGRTTRAMKAVGETLPYMIAPIGLLGATGLSIAGSQVGAGAGRVFGKRKVTGTPPLPPGPADARDTSDVEYVYSPSMEGRVAEGLV